MENTFYLSCCCFLFKMLTTMTKFIFEMSYTPPGSFKEDFNSALGCNITPTNQSNCIKDNKQNKKY